MALWMSGALSEHHQHFTRLTVAELREAGFFCVPAVRTCKTEVVTPLELTKTQRMVAIGTLVNKIKCTTIKALFYC